MNNLTATEKIENKRLILSFLSALIFIFFLSSCSFEPDKPREALAEKTEEHEVETAVPSREAVFTYGKQNNLPKKITLKFSGEPIFFPSGYVRLAGVVRGERQIVCLEVGGRGLALKVGEAVDGYKVISISEKGIVLCKTRN